MLESSRAVTNGRLARACALRDAILATGALVGVTAHLALRFATNAPRAAQLLPLHAVLVIGGVPLVAEFAIRLVRRRFGSDLLAAITRAERERAPTTLRRSRRQPSASRSERRATSPEGELSDF